MIPKSGGRPSTSSQASNTKNTNKRKKLKIALLFFWIIFVIVLISLDSTEKYRIVDNYSFSKRKGRNWKISKINVEIMNCSKHKRGKYFFPNYKYLHNHIIPKIIKYYIR